MSWSNSNPWPTNDQNIKSNVPWTPPAAQPQRPWPITDNQQPLVKAASINPYDTMSQDQVLMEWQKLQKAVADAKEAEMQMRKYIAKRAFPQPKEGMNNLDLGNGYQLKAGINFNYNLDSDNNKVEDALDKIVLIGNEGSFIASRLVSWTPNFLLTEYRQLTQDAKDGNPTSIKIKEIIDKVLTITEKAPTLDIKEPKAKKK